MAVPTCGSGSAAAGSPTMTAPDWDAVYEGDVPDTPVDRHVVELAAGLQPGRAIDLGCGLGQNSIWLAHNGWEVTGLDIAANAIDGARAAAAQAGVEAVFAQADLQAWTPDRSYDLVVSTYALPARGPGRTSALAAAVAALAPGGTLLVAEFDRSLADEGWMAERDLVTTDELVENLSELTIVEAGVANTAHTHGDETAELPVVVVVATRPG